MANYNEMPEPAIRITDKSMIGRLYDAMQDFLRIVGKKQKADNLFMKRTIFIAEHLTYAFFGSEKKRG